MNTVTDHPGRTAGTERHCMRRIAGGDILGTLAILLLVSIPLVIGIIPAVAATNGSLQERSVSPNGSQVRQDGQTSRFSTGQSQDIESLRMNLGFHPTREANDPAAYTATVVIGKETTDQWMRHAALYTSESHPTLLDNPLPDKVPRQPGSTYAADPAPLTAKGRSIFTTRCGLCHTIGQGDGDGPDLQGVTDRRDRGWLTRWLIAPDQVLAEGDPTALRLYTQYAKTEMPNLHLSDHDVAALLAYLEAQNTGK